MKNALVLLIILLAASLSAEAKGKKKKPVPKTEPVANADLKTPGGIHIVMKEVPTIPGASMTFPTTVTDDVQAPVPATFMMSQTETTYALWTEVHTWATKARDGKRAADGGPVYFFANAGTCGGYNNNGYGEYAGGHETHPATNMNWRDAIVWCNALTEFHNSVNGDAQDFDCVYLHNNAVIRDARDSNDAACDQAVPNRSAGGYRLPESAEWEYAARYNGTVAKNAILCNGVYFTKGNAASGAASDTTDSAETASVAVYPGGKTVSTAAVKSKKANALGLYDMSGNVSEWCFDWHPKYVNGARVIRGGGYATDAGSLRTGYFLGINQFTGYNFLGFRFCRNK